MIVGVILFLVDHILPIDPSIKLIIRVLVVLAVILWLVQVFVGDVTLPRLR